MPTSRRPKRNRKTQPSRDAGRRRLRELERQVARLEEARRLDQAQFERRLAAARRAADRKLAMMMQEIATLRHHEARAQALERLLGEREATHVAARLALGTASAEAASGAPATSLAAVPPVDPIGRSL